MKAFREKFPCSDAMWPLGGVISGVAELKVPGHEPEFDTFATGRVDPTSCWPSIVLSEPLNGAGTGIRREDAVLRAMVEGFERYASVVLLEDETIVASARELGPKALDLEKLPRPSERELADPNCPIRPPNLDEPIEWVRGYSITQECERLVPAAISHLSSKPRERFTFPISTGIAAHTALAKAILSAICEVVERDAIALTWLARLPLPRIVVDTNVKGTDFGSALDRLSRSNVQLHLFDATTDVGIPIVYSVQLIEDHPRVAQSVACAAGMDAQQLCEKVVREGMAGRISLAQEVLPVSADPRQFQALHEGAIYMGAPEHRPAFDFLLRGEKTVRLSEMMRDTGEDHWVTLNRVVERFRALEMDVCIVDLTTDELRDVGLWVIRAVIPSLMPMSVVHRSRFLGTPRLYDYARRMGRVITEDDINPYPQPFA